MKCNLFALIFCRRYFSTSTAEVKKSDELRGVPKKKAKTLESPKILLVSESNAKSVVTLEEANKLALRKGLHLIPVEKAEEKNVQTDKPVYKLVTNAVYLALEKANNALSR
jgi:hypothetical protein